MPTFRDWVAMTYPDPRTRFSQEEILSVMGAAETRSGLCLALSIQFIINCSSSVFGPAHEFRQLKGQKADYFKQLVGRQATYESLDADLWKVYGRASHVIAYGGILNQMSNGSLGLHPPSNESFYFDELRREIVYACSLSTLRWGSVLVALEGETGHSIVVLRESFGGSFYVFDPENGFLECWDEQDLGTLVRMMWEGSGYVRASVFPVMK